jgi:cytochrome c556
MRTAQRLALVAVTIAAAAGIATGQGTYNKSAFEKVMDDTMKGLRLTMGSLVFEDWAKAQGGAETIGANAKTIHGLTPKVAVDRIAEFQANADSLAARSARVAAAAKAHQPEAASRALGQVVQTCMSCHAVFAK